ncbi:cytochrome P450 family protein [Ceratobasidium sp. AG-Ba]|nr:cytochrome P450 family protein [Ceratobasidium sp. AG-Ba]QRV98592.1 cytochrome P450 family protein [Ceratobasidium sp. AG-Ba]
MDTLWMINRDQVHRYATFENGAYLLGVLVALKVAQLSYDPIRKLFSPLRHLDGPPNESLIFGHMKRVFAATGSSLQEEWKRQYGPTFVYRGFLSSWRLHTTDTRALSFIMNQSQSFPKPEAFRRGLADVLGEGILFADFEGHKRQRRVMNPAFGPSQVRELVPIFWQKSNKLRDAWLDLIKATAEDVATIEVLSWLSRTTLDIIGAAGFDYHFNALENDHDELAIAFAKIFDAGPQFTVLGILKGLFPALRVIPDQRSRILQANMAIMQRIGTKLVADKKAALEQEIKTGTTAQSRDLLTLLIKANMACESEDSRMTDSEVLGQISTFLVAGHETTSTSTTWGLYALAKHREVQQKLRKELLESGFGDEPSMTDLDRLPYLDSVVREILRLHAPVPGTLREAAHDIEIPVSQSFKDRHGVERMFISLQKGDTIMLPVQVTNCSVEVWGENASEFCPERWDDLPSAANEMPGVWGHIMTFLTGSHSCIGYRFAVVEMKALLYTLVRSIEFDISPTIVIEGKTAMVTRPRVASEPEKGNQMPLICRPVVAM